MIENAPITAGIVELIRRALSEDVGAGDVTSNALIPTEARGRARFSAKQDMVVAGLSVVAEVLRQVDSDLLWTASAEDAQPVVEGDELMSVVGLARSILRAERTALNFLQRMSGVATMTRDYVEAVSGTGVRITDTRKTVPGHRLLDKYAVLCGGGTNHRTGLFDAVLIKNNHLEFHPSAAEAVRIARDGNPGLTVEVEVRDLAELDSALAGSPDLILLDNFTVAATREAVRHVRGRVELESSGGITISNVRDYAESGVQRISVGALTHSVRAADIHLRVGRLESDGGI